MNTYTKEINGIKYTIKVDDMLYFQSQALWRAISDIPVGRLKDGFKIQIGFSLYILQKAISGYCIVTPDYEPTPFLKVTEDLTLAFWIQMEQLDMLQKYHINGEEGTIAVIGPKRMDYQKIVGLLEYIDEELDSRKDK